jgi:F-type H+-transporting ATPase subunit b
MLAASLALVLAAEETKSSRLVLPHGDEILWGSIAFFVLFSLLAWKVFPQVNRILAERQARIRGSLEQAENARLEAERLLEQYRRQLDEARSEASKIIEEAKRTAESVRREILARAEQEGQEIVARARADAASEAARARQRLQQDLAALALELASRVIERELSQPESHRAFVERTIAELAATGDGAGGNGRRA